MSAAQKPPPQQQTKLTRPVGVKPAASGDMMAPHSIEAEEAVIGMVLQDPDLFAQIADRLMAHDFFIVRNGWYWESFSRLTAAHEEISTVSVTEDLRQQPGVTDNQYNESGGIVYMTELTMRVPGVIFPDTFIGIIQRAADRRRWLSFASRIAKEAHSESGSIGTQFTTLLGEFMHCRPRDLNRGLILSDMVQDRFWELQSRLEGEHKVFPLPWNGADERGLPYATGGKVMVWGGDKKTGKTAGCETLAEHWLALGMNGFYIHTEQTGDDMILRRFSRWSGVPFLRLETPWKLSDKEILKREDAITITSAWPGAMEFYRDMPLTPDKALAAMRRAVNVFDVDFIVLDQFTSLHWGDDSVKNPANQRYDFVSQVVDFAERTGILIVISTQMINALDGRRAYGTNALNDLAALFFDVEQKKLKDPLTYRADGDLHTLRAGSFDPRVDLNPVLARFTSSASIPLFYDGRRLLWRDRSEIEIVSEGIT